MSLPNSPSLPEPAVDRSARVSIEFPETLKLVAGTGAAKALETRIRLDLATWCEELGLPARLQLELAPVARLAAGSEFPLKIRINGALARYSPELLSIVQGYCAGAPADCDMHGEILVQWLAQAATDQSQLAHEFVSLAVLEVLKRNVHMLIGDEMLRRCAETALGGLPLSPAENKRMIGALQTLAGLGLPISPIPGLWAAGRAGEHDFRARFESVLSALKSNAVEWRLPAAYLREIASAEAGTWRDPLIRVLEATESETGVRVPSLRVVFDETLKPGCFRFRINNTLTPPFCGLAPGQCLVNAAAGSLKQMVPDARPALNPGSGCDAALVSSANREALEQAGYTCWTSSGYVALALSESLRRRLNWFLDESTVAELLEDGRAVSPRIVRVVEALLAKHELARLLRALCFGQAPLHNLKKLLEVIADVEYAGASDVVAAIRAGLRREICGRHVRQSVVVAYLVDGSIVEALDEPADGEEAGHERVLAALRQELAQLPRTITPPVLLTTPSARLKVGRAIQDEFPRLAVLTYDELDPEISVQPIARIAC
jgi:hypothetical protein